MKMGNGGGGERGEEEGVGGYLHSSKPILGPYSYMDVWDRGKKFDLQYIIYYIEFEGIFVEA